MATKQAKLRWALIAGIAAVALLLGIVMVPLIGRDHAADSSNPGRTHGGRRDESENTDDEDQQ